MRFRCSDGATADQAENTAGTVWIAEANDQMLGLIVLIDADDHILLDNIAVDPCSSSRR